MPAKYHWLVIEELYITIFNINCCEYYMHPTLIATCHALFLLQRNRYFFLLCMIFIYSHTYLSLMPRYVKCVHVTFILFFIFHLASYFILNGLLILLLTKTREGGLFISGFQIMNGWFIRGLWSALLLSVFFSILCDFISYFFLSDSRVTKYICKFYIVSMIGL